MRAKTSFFGYFAVFLSGVLLSALLLLCHNLIVNPTGNSIKIISSVPSVESIDLPSSLLADEGKINLNTASLDELDQLPGIGPSKAESIIDFRLKYGQFEEISELLFVPGIGQNLFENIQELITTGNEQEKE